MYQENVSETYRLSKEFNPDDHKAIFRALVETSKTASFYPPIPGPPTDDGEAQGPTDWIEAIMAETAPSLGLLRTPDTAPDYLCRVRERDLRFLQRHDWGGPTKGYPMTTVVKAVDLQRLFLRDPETVGQHVIQVLSVDVVRFDARGVQGIPFEVDLLSAKVPLIDEEAEGKKLESRRWFTRKMHTVFASGKVQDSPFMFTEDTKTVRPTNVFSLPSNVTAVGLDCVRHAALRGLVDPWLVDAETTEGNRLLQAPTEAFNIAPSPLALYIAQSFPQHFDSSSVSVMNEVQIHNQTHGRCFQLPMETYKKLAAKMCEDVLKDQNFLLNLHGDLVLQICPQMPEAQWKAMNEKLVKDNAEPLRVEIVLRIRTITL